MDYKYGDRQKELNTNNCRLFAIASWTLLCSFLQFRSGKPTIYFNVEVLFPVIFAALNTVTEILYHRQYAKIYFKESDENGLKKYLLFRGMVFFLFYFAIYNTVLLPMSGIGFFEYAFVAFVLVYFLYGNLKPRSIVIKNTTENSTEDKQITKIEKLQVFISSKNTILLLHVVLFLIRVFTWLLPENFYRDSVTGNDSIRTVLAIGVVTMIFLLAISGYTACTRKLKIPKKTLDTTYSKIGNIGKKVGNAIATGVKKGAKVIGDGLKLVLKPLPIAIITLAIILVAGITGIIIIMNIKEDFAMFADILLGNIFSTGKYSTELIPLFIVTNIVVVICYLLFLLYKDSKPKADDIDYLIKNMALEDNSKESEFFRNLYSESKTNSSLQEELIHNSEYYKRVSQLYCIPNQD